MSTLNPTKKISRRQELREDKVVTFYARALELTDRYRNLVYGAVAAVIVVVLGFVAYSFYQAGQQTEAVDRMSAAVAAYEAGSYQTALDGTGNSLGLLDIIDSYGSTDAGNLARFYAADSYFRLGNYQEALPLFRAFDKDATILGASAVAGEAAILESTGEPARAADLYARAATMYPSNATSPAYFLSAGRAYEAAGKPADARRVYQRIQNEYPQSPEARDIAFYLARVDG